MMERTNSTVDVSQRIYVSVKEVAGLFGVGLNKANSVGIAAGAKVKIGGRALYNVEKIKAYLDAQICEA